MDLRGYGQSSKPDGGKNHEAYSKTNMARDCDTLMKKQGFDQYFVCGHDRGGRVGHKLCVNHPKAVKKAMFLDICPTLAMYEKTDFTFAMAYFHWFFLIRPAPWPENAITKDPLVFASQGMGGRCAGIKVFHPDAYAAYLKGLGDYDTVHAMCEDYRAAASVDLDEAREDIKEGRKIKAPLRVLWAQHGIIEKCFDAIAEWKAVHSTGEVDGSSVDSGHYIPEEVPQILLESIREFFG